MKVNCNRGALLDALNLTGNVIAARTPKPVLQCLKLTAEENALIVAATDLEVAIRYRDEQVQIEQGGETLVPADKLRDIVRESIDDTLAIETTGDTANIRGQDSHFKIFTQKATDFPPIPDFEGDADVQLPGGALRQTHQPNPFCRGQGKHSIRLQWCAGGCEGEENLVGFNRWPTVGDGQRRPGGQRQARQ